MAGEAASLKNFLVSFGYVEDSASAKKALADHAATEKKATATNEAEVAKRQKIEEKAGDRRRKQSDESAKKDTDRNRTVLEDVEKRLVRLGSVVRTVVGAVGAVGGAIAGSAAFANIAGVASSYSRLLTESQRTGASPRNINALVYALGQAGVDKGTARSSFGGFAKAIQQSPGLKALIAGAGINVNGDTADTFAQLGKYFNSMPPQTALAMAGHFNIDQDSLNALKKGGIAEGMQGYDKIAGSFGLDPDKASKDAREFSNAYDHLAEDLHTIQGKIANNFYKPLTTAMTHLSALLEGNGGKVTALGTAFEGLALTLSVSAIPRLLRLAGILGGMTAPPWLVPLIAYLTAGGMISKQSADALQASKPGANDVYVDPETGLATSVTPGSGNQVTGTPGAKGAARAALGRRVGTQADTRNWWQRHAPTVLGGQDAPARSTLGHSVRAEVNDNPEIVAYIKEAAAARGIDPDTALSIAGHEGLHGFDPNRPDPGGDQGTSFSPWQMHFASNKAGVSLPGLGDAMLRDTGVDPRDPKNWKATTDYALDYAKKHGWSPWHGRIPAHIGVWDGIGTYKAPPPSADRKPPSLKDSGVRFDKDGYALNPDGSRTMNNFDPKTGMVSAPLGPQSYNAKGDTHYTQNIHVTGVQKPQEVADAVTPVARRGAQDHIRFIESSSV